MEERTLLQGAGFCSLAHQPLSPVHCVKNIGGVIKKYGENLHEKVYYDKRHVALNPQNTPTRLEHTYSIILAIF